VKPKTSRFNYTGRLRIKRANIDLVVREGPPRRFSASWNLSGGPLPSDARVRIEATSSGSPMVRRFDGGTVGEPAYLTDVELGDVGGDTPVFSIKVVDVQEDVGRIVAAAEGLHAERPDLEDDDHHRAALLPVNYRDLGERVWQVSFDNAQPWLEINKHLPDTAAARSMVRDDPRFAAMVFPEVVERVLEHVLITHNQTAVVNDDSDWKDLWLRLGVAWTSSEPPTLAGDEPTIVEADELRAWAREAADALCLKKGWRDAFVAVIDGDNS
jgi:hypothetical protein